MIAEVSALGSSYAAQLSSRLDVIRFLVLNSGCQLHRRNLLALSARQVEQLWRTLAKGVVQYVAIRAKRTGFVSAMAAYCSAEWSCSGGGP